MSTRVNQISMQSGGRRAATARRNKKRRTRRRILLGSIALLLVLLLGGFLMIAGEAPILAGAQDIVVYNDAVPDYLAGVTATSSDGAREIAVQVNDSAVKTGVAGVYPVTYTARDWVLYKASATVNVTVVIDHEPPVITGVRDIEVLLGAAIVYKEGVEVTDNADPDPTLTIDTTGVDVKTPGEYTVKYIATDAAGNQSVAEAKLVILAGDKDGYSPHALNVMVEGILGNIISDSMTQGQKTYAIYIYAKDQISYVGVPMVDDWQKGAFLGLKYGYGDCYTYYAVSRALLTAAGIENMEITRVGGDIDHYWNLVNCGTGWYHFDATVPYNGYPKKFMMTDAYTKEYSAWIYDGLGIPNFYNYDPALYPEMATAEFVY